MSLFRFDKEPAVVLKTFPEFASRYGGTVDSCADAYLDDFMTTDDKADYEERFFVANRILLRLIPRLRAAGVLK